MSWGAWYGPLLPAAQQQAATGTTISAPFINATATTYAPSVKLTITAPFIDATATTYAPSVKLSITAPFIDQTAVVYTPAAHTTRVYAPFIDATATVTAPSVTFKIYAPFIDDTAVTYAPSVTQKITAPFIDQTAVTYTPTVHVTKIYAPFIDATATVTAPSVTFKVTAPFIDATAQTFAPSVTQKVSAPFIDATASTYAPSVTLKVSAPFIDATATVTAPSVTFRVTAPFIDATAVTYAPTVTAGGASVTASPPFIDQTAVTYTPTVHFSKVYAPFLAAYVDQVVADGAVALWMLDEPSGTTVSDYIGSLDGSYENSPTLGVTGPITGYTGTDFDSADNDGVLITDATALHIADENVTSWSVEAWFKGASSVADFGGPAIVAMDYNFGYGNVEYSLGFMTTEYNVYDDKPSVAFRDATGTPPFQIAKSDTAIDDGQWHHIVGVFRNGSWPVLDLYVDGVHKAQNAAMTNYPKSMAGIGVAGLRIGRGPTSSQEIDGSIAAVAIYDSALSGAQIASHYAAAAIPGQARVFTPTVTVQEVVTAPFLDYTGVVYAPAVKLAVSPPWIDQTAVTYAPTAVVAITVSPPWINQGAVTHTPAVLVSDFITPSRGRARDDRRPKRRRAVL